ncbi:MAG: hypothetical protein ABIP16_09575 [Thermomonas sp.]
MKEFDKRSQRQSPMQAAIPGRGRSAFTGRRINLLYAFMTLAMAAPAVHADDIFDDAWQCASTVVKGVGDLAGTGAKALEFVASPGGGVCVTRLGTPMTAAPIAMVLTLANGGILQENCSATLYNTAAIPIAFGLSKLPILPNSFKAPLAAIVAGEAGEAAGVALQKIPGIETVTGSLTCGCNLYDAGLSIETIKRVLNTADRIGDACGGPVWAATKEVAGAVVAVAGDAVGAGYQAASSVVDWMKNEDKNMSNTAYFDQFWAPNIEHFAAVEFKSPGAWDDQDKWRELWDPCVTYFVDHTLGQKNAQNVCDAMRSGDSHPNYFAGKGFSQRMFRRVFEFDVTGAVDAARKQALTDNADMQITVQGTKDPMATDRNRDYHDANFPAERPKFIRESVNAVFGIPTKEKKHDGLVVSNSAPPTTWPADTVGARAFDFYDQVKGDQGNHRADAAKAVQLAMQDMDVTAQVRAGAEQRTLAFYSREDSINLGSASESDQDKVNAMVEQCPTDTCRDGVGLGYRTCSIATEAFKADNAAALANWESPQNRWAQSEVDARGKACLAQAKKTLRGALNHVAGETPMHGNAVPQVKTDVGRYTSGTTSDGGHPTRRDEANTGRNTPVTRTGRNPFDGVLRNSVPVSRDADAAPADEVSPAEARITPDSLGETVAADDIPGCTSARNRGQWICDTSDGYDRCLVAKRRGAALECALRTP